MSTKRVIKGDSYAFALHITGLTDLTGYTCQVQLRENDGTLLVDKPVLSSVDATYGEVFVVRLTPTESSALIVGESYTLAAQISNAAAEFAAEEVRTLTIADEYVY